jgi:hypothetical protein
MRALAVIPLVLIGIALLFPFMVSAKEAPRDAIELLREMQWSKRPLLVFAASQDQPEMLRFEDEAEGLSAELLDRHMVIFRIFPAEGDLDGRTALTRASVAALRKEFAVKDEEFLMVLIGKDGGEKGSYTDPEALPRIFERIDAMPMRRREMLERKAP